jgi:hypothetical protein
VPAISRALLSRPERGSLVVAAIVPLASRAGAAACEAARALILARPSRQEPRPCAGVSRVCETLISMEVVGFERFKIHVRDFST